MSLFRKEHQQRPGGERRISFLIAPSWGANTLHWSLPVWGARLVVGGLILVVLAFLIGIGYYGKVLAEARDAEHLRQENAKLRSHYQKLVELEAELAGLSEELAQLRRIAGLDVYEEAGPDSTKQPAPIRPTTD